MKTLDWLILRMAEWVMRRRLNYLRGGDADHRSRILVRRELAAIPETVAGYISYSTSEVDILSDRLSRRFDPGMALEEATQRAQVQKQKLLQEAQGMGLTSTQLASLEFQKQRRMKTIRSTR